MSVRLRLILAMALLIGAGLLGFVYWVVNELRPRYMATMEEGMIDTATIFAATLETQLGDGGEIRTGQLSAMFTRAERAKFSARIYEELKEQLEMRIYVTDASGIVIFDSDGGRDEGCDYSRWNDVLLTLRGQYGARATPAIKGQPETAVLYVAAPVRSDDEIVGAVTVCKPARSATRFLVWARLRIVGAGLFAVAMLVTLGIVIYSWLTIPLERLARHARAVREGWREPLPNLGRGEIAQLGEAFEEMRDELEGKQYVTHYVQTLTHEMKSPLSAIRGAAELLGEETMPEQQRRRFLENIRDETGRMQDLIDRLLQLAALESKKALGEAESIAPAALARETIRAMKPAIEARGLKVETAFDPTAPCAVGDAALLGHALGAMLQNAIDFSPRGATVKVAVEGPRGTGETDGVTFLVEDQGPGVPDYAMERVFDRFYSLARPGAGKKSSGLGLSIVREIAVLHGGAIRLENIPGGGARAVLTLPVK